MRALRRKYLRGSSSSKGGLGDGELAVIIHAQEPRSFPVKVLTDDNLARKVASQELGKDSVAGVFDLVWLATRTGRIDRAWLEKGVNHLTPTFASAEEWPSRIGEYASRSGIVW
jgi:predicted nucleic acid-binding protein